MHWDRLAPDRHHRRPGLSQLCLRAQPNQGCARSGDAKGAICYAPISPKATPRLFWQYYIQLVAVEEAFKNLKGDSPSDRSSITRNVGSRPISSSPSWPIVRTPGHQRRLPHALAPGLSARSAIEKFAAVQMIDVHVPTTDGRELVLTRYTQPEPELQLLINQPQAPTTTPAAAENHHRRPAPPTPCRSEDFSTQPVDVQRAENKKWPQSK